jgi:hypothetical protein
VPSPENTQNQVTLTNTSGHLQSRHAQSLARRVQPLQTRRRRRVGRLGRCGPDSQMTFNNQAKKNKTVEENAMLACVHEKRRICALILEPGHRVFGIQEK